MYAARSRHSISPLALTGMRLPRGAPFPRLNKRSRPPSIEPKCTAASTFNSLPANATVSRSRAYNAGRACATIGARVPPCGSSSPRMTMMDSRRAVDPDPSESTRGPPSRCGMLTTDSRSSLWALLPSAGSNRRRPPAPAGSVTESTLALRGSTRATKLASSCTTTSRSPAHARPEPARTCGGRSSCECAASA